MFEEDKEKKPMVGNSLRRQYNVSNHSDTRFSELAGKMHSINGLHLISALSQIFLGIAVVALSLINKIQPLWLATVMTILGSISTMIGLYFVYSTVTRNGVFDSLLHKAIKRVISSQN
jgi:hypothetical protein